MKSTTSIFKTLILASSLALAACGGGSGSGGSGGNAEIFATQGSVAVGIGESNFRPFSGAGTSNGSLVFADKLLAFQLALVSPNGATRRVALAVDLISLAGSTLTENFWGIVELKGGTWDQHLLVQVGGTLSRVSQTGDILELATNMSLASILGVTGFAQFGDESALALNPLSGELFEIALSDGDSNTLAQRADFEAVVGGTFAISTLLSLPQANLTYAVGLDAVVSIAPNGTLSLIASGQQILDDLPPGAASSALFRKAVVDPSTGDVVILIGDFPFIPAPTTVGPGRYLVRVAGDGSGATLLLDVNSLEPTAGIPADGITDVEFLTTGGITNLYFKERSLGSIYRFADGSSVVVASSVSVSRDTGTPLTMLFMDQLFGLVPIPGTGFAVWNDFTKDFILVRL